MKYLIKKKDDAGKWKTHGVLGPNNWDNLSLSLRVSPELRSLISSAKEGEWVHLSVFEDNREDSRKEQPQEPVAVDLGDDSIPF